MVDPENQVNLQKQPAKRGRKDLDGDDESATSNGEIKSILLSLTDKIDTMNVTMSGNDARLNSKIDSLECALTAKIADVKKEMETRIQTVATDINLRLDNSMSTTKQRVDELQAIHESRLDRLERVSLEKDLVISGVPVESKDEPFAILGDICKALNCDLQQGDFASAFRLRSNRANSESKRSLPIVVRINFDWVKEELLRAYFQKKNLNLTDLGFKTPSRIFINERLTSKNREIFNRAAEAKKSNLIQRFFTRRGLVYVQHDVDSQPSSVLHISDLDTLLPADRPRIPRTRYAPAQRRQQKPPVKKQNVTAQSIDHAATSSSSGTADVHRTSNVQQSATDAVLSTDKAGTV